MKDQHKRNKLYIYFVLRIHNELIAPSSSEPLTLRSQSRLDEVCKCIIRENYVRAGLLPLHSYSTKFRYRYFLPRYFNYVAMETQDKYTDTLDNHRSEMEAVKRNNDSVPAEYINIEVEVELRILE